jgi:hypothetical protein
MQERDAMATFLNPKTHISTCNCNTGVLLTRAINLIDPPLYSVVDDANKNTAGGCLELVRNGSGSETIHDSSLESEGVHKSQTPGSTSDEKQSVANELQTVCSALKKQKKVQFKESPSHHRKKISTHEIKQAHNLLMHAISINQVDLLSEICFKNTSWDTLQQYTDTYRAALITSCLLLEMLPSECDNHSIDEHVGSPWPYHDISCPTPSANSPPKSLPHLSPAITKELFSVSRRCILMLQHLEKISAAKSISERHTKRSFYTGGDDIEDYDRCTRDLHMSYDWHDDGFLPKPGLYKTDNTHSILHECCYRPHNLSVQPSSRYEKTASTKEWVRGERLISMRIEDYEYCNDLSLCNNHDAIEQNNAPNQECAGNNSTTESEIILETDGCIEEAPFFTLSPHALAKEEQFLQDIMSPNERANSTEDTSIARRKKKRRKHKSQMLIVQAPCTADGILNKNSSLGWKEGYILLGYNKQSLPLTKRVYAKVRPLTQLFIHCIGSSFPTAE